MSYANDIATAADIALASALRLAVMRLARRLRAQRSRSDLTASQLAALATLDRHGPLTPGELASYERVQPPSMTRIVASLEAGGQVIRSAHPSDGRQVLLSPSRQGRVLLQEDRRRRDAWLARQLEQLDTRDLATLRRASEILDRLAAT